MCANYTRIAPILCRQLSMVPRSCCSTNSVVPARLYWRFRPWHYFPDISSFETRMREIEHDMDRIFRDVRPKFWRATELPLNMEVRRDGKNKKVEVNLDLGNFKPSEVKVSINNRTLSIHAKREESDESGKSIQEYYRQFTLPEEVDLSSLKSLLSNDGILRVEGTIPGLESGEPIEIPIKKDDGGGDKKEK